MPQQPNQPPHLHGAIWAQSTDGVIGDGKSMPWHLPEDLAHFKDTTHGHPVLMGRGTWESLPERFRPLPGRDNHIVSSKQPGQWSAGATVHKDIPDLPEAWVIGGGQLYASTIEHVRTIVVTEVDALLADALPTTAVTAPTIPAGFEVTEQSPWHTSQKGRLTITEQPHNPASATTEPLRYRFLTYQRKDS